jgi:Flagellar hook capping protein
MARTNSELSQYWSDYKLNSVSTQYEIAKTGISHPIIITELTGSVEVGDELVAYAGEMVVGATKVVDLDAPVVISAWAGYHEYGVDLDGYTLGDKIDLRLWSASESRELRVVSDLDNDEFGVGPLTAGTATVSMQDAIPTEVNLSQNYPNPFNPTTRIDYSVVSDGHVTLNVYDITGRLISTLVDGYVDSGYHSVMWNGIDDNGKMVAAGIYFYTLQGESSSMTRKMVYMK